MGAESSAVGQGAGVVAGLRSQVPAPWPSGPEGSLEHVATLLSDDDPLITLADMRLLARRIANSQLHVIGDGHLFLIARA